MKLFKILSLSLLAAAIVACNDKKEPEVTNVSDEEIDSVGIASLRDYNRSDTMKIDGRTYKFTYSREHIDTMRTVINAQGLEYYESRVSVKVTTGNELVFNKTFYKRDFRDYVPKDELSLSTMVGVNFNYVKRQEDRSALYFIISVGDPDEASDMVWPFELKIATNGTYTITKANDLDTGPINPGMNVDPDEDAEV